MAESGLGVEQARRESMWSTPYLLVCAAFFLSFSNRTMLDPVLPLYLLSVGQSPAFIGITIALFSVASFLTRPFLGQAVDRWSGRGVYALGGLALAAASFAYLLPSMVVLLGARVVHGSGWAAFNTAAAVLASESTPASRRGEAIGYLNMMPSLSTALLPALGLWLVSAAGFHWAFALSGALGLAAASVAATIRERPRVQAVASEGDFWNRLIERRVALPALLLVLVNFTYPIITVFVVLYAQARGIEHLGWFFLASGLAMAAAQSLGRVSDRWGRKPVVAASFALGALGLAIMMQATEFLPLVIGGIIGSAGTATAHATLMALAIDLAQPERRGAAVATYTAAFQVGTGSAGLLWGTVIQWWGFDQMFLGAIALLLVGLAVLAGGARSRRRSGEGGANPAVSSPL